MKYRLFTFAPTLSLMLCVATVVLWSRSYWTGDELTVLRRSETDRQIAQYKFYSGRGVIFLSRVVYVFRTPEQVARFGPPSGILRGSFHPPLAGLDGKGALVPRMGSDATGGVVYAIVPLWCIASPLLIPFGWRMIRFRQIRRRQSRLECPNCGYDLRASNDRCPECGTTIRSHTDASV